jgi:integrase
MPKRIPQFSSVTHKSLQGSPNARHVASVLTAIDRCREGLVLKCAIKLAVLLAVRLRELCYAKWTEIDLAKEHWIIPPQKKKTRQQHIVPLSRQAIAILRELHVYTGSSRYVFPSPRSLHRCMSENAVNAAFRSLRFKGGSCSYRVMAAGILHEMGLTDGAAVRLRSTHQG